ncbi:MAG: UbiD family decarboxylase, partial [Deltaproteobacteria bacterium]|nr:UbiD family decarboxylase [Deltaproteobacteria bacterium]
MAYHSLQEFVQALEREGELKRIAHPVKAELEITEIADRVMKSGSASSPSRGGSRDGGPALLFENVVGKNIPVLINAFGSLKRMAMALGVADIEEIAREIERLTRMKPPGSLWDKLRML